MSTWVAYVIGLLGPALVVAAIRFAAWAWHSANKRLTFPDLAIRVAKSERKGGRSKISLKLAYGANNPLIIESVTITSQLSLRRRDSFLAWLQLAVGYLTDDVEGLRAVLGTEWSSSAGVFAAPVHKIKRSNLRRPLSSLLGILMLWLFAGFVANPFTWPFLLAGPYCGFKLVADDDTIQIRDAVTEQEVTRPFILTPPLEKTLHLTFRLSLKAPGFSSTTPYVYVDAAPKLHAFELPRPGNFVLRGKQTLQLRVNGKWRECRTAVGTELVSIG